MQAHGLVFESLQELWKGHEKEVLSKRERKKRGQDHPSVEDNLADTAQAGTQPQPYPPRICLHSFSGPAETVKLYTAPTVPCEVFFSFSTTINSWVEGGQGKVEAAVRAVPDDRLLVESDLHTAGERMDQYLEEGVRKLCEVKGWELEAGTKQLAANWRRFVAGGSWS